MTIDQGEKLFLRNQDPFAQHNVFSTGSGGDGSQFKSETVSNGVRTIVEGAQYLTTGTYNFVCTLHAPGMAGTLHVTSAGQPLPRPGAGVPDTVAPTVSLSILTSRAASLQALANVERRRAIQRGRDGLAEGDHRVGWQDDHVRAREGQVLRRGVLRQGLSLTKAGRKALKGKRGITVKVVARAVDAAGNIGKATRSRRLSA